MDFLQAGDRLLPLFILSDWGGISDG